MGLSDVDKQVAERLALVACGDPWLSLALQSVLEPAGYRVTRAPTGAAALEQAARSRLDLICLCSNLPDLGAAAVCRQLRDDGLVAGIIPIVVICMTPLQREDRLEALRSGAWTILGFPFDAEELIVKLDSFVRSKRVADRAWEHSLVDPVTGFYNTRGITRRAAELYAEAIRRHAPFACVVLGAEPEETPRKRWPGIPGHIAGMLQKHGRLSDTIGLWNESEFAVLAPSTDADGAEQLAERLIGIVSFPSLAAHAGFDVLEAGAAARPAELLAHANAALRAARSAKSRVRRYGRLTP